MWLLGTSFNLALFLLAFYLLKRFVLFRTSGLPYPPGPAGFPIINNLFDWPSSKEWEVFTLWARTYGDIVHVNVAGTHMIILNSVELARKLFQGKANIYSDRPSLYMQGNLVGWNKTTFLMNDGPELKESRRLIAQEIGTRASITRFIPMIQTRNLNFLRMLLSDRNPEETLEGHLSTLSSAIILDVTYGYNVTSPQDSLVALSRRVLDDSAEASRPGAFLVDIFPWIDWLPAWFPGTAYKMKAAEQRRRFTDFRELPYKYTLDHMHSSQNARQSFIAAHVYDQELTAEQEDNLQHTGAMMYAAGADTIVTAIHYFFLFMTLYPEVQAKAQAEIDRVVGAHRLPDLSDRSELPYVDALVSEVLRCGPVNPQGVAHRLRVDDTHNGYFLPQNAIVIPNAWFMARDARNYKNPDLFDPARFMGEAPELDPRAFFFGFGRRICAGQAFADASLFITCAIVLASASISKVVDSDGLEVIPLAEPRGEGGVMRLKSFPFSISIRSDKAGSLLNETLSCSDL